MALGIFAVLALWLLTARLDRAGMVRNPAILAGGGRHLPRRADRLHLARRLVRPHPIALDRAGDGLRLLHRRGLHLGLGAGSAPAGRQMGHRNDRCQRTRGLRTMYGTVATAKSMPAAGVGTAAIIAGSHHWSLGLTALVATPCSLDPPLGRPHRHPAHPPPRGLATSCAWPCERTRTATGPLRCPPSSQLTTGSSRGESRCRCRPRRSVRRCRWRRDAGEPRLSSPPRLCWRGGQTPTNVGMTSGLWNAGACGRGGPGSRKRSAQFHLSQIP